MRKEWVSEATWTAFYRKWLNTSELHGFPEEVAASPQTLNEFVLLRLSFAGSSQSILQWNPYQWLWPDFVPPAPFMVRDKLITGSGSGELVEPILSEVLECLFFFKEGAEACSQFKSFSLCCTVECSKMLGQDNHCWGSGWQGMEQD